MPGVLTGQEARVPRSMDLVAGGTVVVFKGAVQSGNALLKSLNICNPATLIQLD